MKKAELKRALKPLVKECIKEVLFEDGVLSGIIAEVVTGLGAGQVVMEQKTQQVDKETMLREKAEKMEAERQRRIKKLNESTGLAKKVNVFEGVFKNLRTLLLLH